MWKEEIISPNCGGLACTICVPVIAISSKSNQSFIKLSMYIQPFFSLGQSHGVQINSRLQPSSLFCGKHRNILNKI
jgi:hypothetical protein